jgi:hypothetical protein
MEAIRRLLTSKDRAEREHRSVRTIERERERGDGCPYVQLGRRIYYRPEDVEQFISAHVRGNAASSGAESKPSPRRLNRGRQLPSRGAAP